MPNEVVLIIVLVITVPLGLLVLMIVTLVKATQALREVSQLRGYIETLQRETNGQLERLRRQMREMTEREQALHEQVGREQPVVGQPIGVSEVAHGEPTAGMPPAIVVPVEPPAVAAPAVPQPPALPPISESKPVSAPLPPRDAMAVSKPKPQPQPQPMLVADAPAAKAPVAKPKRTLEERLGTQLPIWIGAIALGIGGIWLAKYLFDKGIFTEPMRVIAGSLFGLGLLIAGSWGHKRNHHIAAAVVAAAIADLYGWVFAAASMYDLIPIWLGFVVMIMITATAVGLSLRQGPIVAVVGMVGAFLTPVLLRTGDQNVAVFAYLFLLQVGLLVVTRRRGWWPLAALTLAGSLIWAGGWVIGMMMHHLPFEHGKWVAMFMLGSAASVVFGADSDEREVWPLPGVGRVLAWATLLASLAVLSLVVQVTQFGGVEWALFGVLAAGCMALGRLRKQYEALAWLVDAVLLGLVTMWAAQAHHHIDEVWLDMALTLLGFGSLFTFGAFACAWGSDKPARWFGMSAGSAVAWYVLAYRGLMLLPVGWKWWTVALIVAAVLVGLSVIVHKRRSKIVGGDESLAWMLIGTSVMLAIAAALGLSGQNITMAWAIEVPAIAFIGCRLRVPWLKPMAAMVAAGVLVRLVCNWHVLDYPINDHIIFNWLSYGYGLPIVAFVLAAWVYHRYQQAEPYLQLLLEGGAILLGFVLVCLQVRHGFHRESFRENDLTFIEAATYLNAWMVAALVLLVGASQWGRRTLALGGAVIGAIALGATAAVLVSPLNPLFGDVSVGATPVFNWLLYAFGLPIIWCIAGMWAMRKSFPQSAPQLSIVALILLFVLVSLQIRHGFHPAAMKLRDMSLIELATYCIAWLVLAGGLFAASRKWAGRILETSGLAIGIIAMFVVLTGLMVVQNPWWADEPVGAHRIFNWLLYVYGLPMLLVGVFAWLVGQRQQIISTIAGVLAIVLLWLTVTLQVRQWFVGELLNVAGFTKPEQYTYSAAWVLLGLSLLTAGIVAKGKLMRFASLAVMLLVVFKVFIFDTRHLVDLYRVFSFIGLGVSLLVLAFCYQRFVFHRPSQVKTDAPPSDGPPSLP